MPFPKAFVRPDAIRAYIGSLYPGGVPAADAGGTTWNREHAGQCAALLEAIGQLDPAIVAAGLQTAARAFEWSSAIGAVRYHLTVWESREMNLPSRPVSTLYALLADFPAELTPVAIARLPFVLNDDLRVDIGRDIDSMDPLIRDEQWKAATVVGGSVIDALLLDALSARLAEARAYATAQRQAMQAQPHPPGEPPPPRWDRREPGRWELWQLIAAAQHLGIIDEALAGMCNAVRWYRNLIHAGAGQRLQQKPTLGTALSARAAIERLLDHFAGGYPPGVP